MNNRPVLFTIPNVFCNKLKREIFNSKELVGETIVEKPIEYYQLEQSIAGAVFPKIKISQEMYEKMKADKIEQKEVNLTFIYKVGNKNKYIAEVFDYELIKPLK